jgi:alkanesulfonate monooxygenase SsuD/methylene tetrahydromethanopterin reductase-like flavin-dependent oxidoreductase (luciferase family)
MEVTMHFGLYLPTEGDFADVRLLAHLAQDAEDAGWDGFFIWDALLPIYEHSDRIRDALGETGDIVDPFVALTAIAAGTTRLRFGALVTPLPRLRPEAFARQTATLDQFSDGRLIVGVGLGNPPDQFTAFGGEADLRVRAAMLDEFLDVLLQLWSGNKVNTRGAHYVAEGISMTPTPHQRPRIPIWIGADSKNRAPRRRAARWDGFVPASDSWPDGVISPADYEAIVADVTALRSEAHEGPFDVVVIGNVSGTRPTTESLSAYAAAGVTWVLSQALSVADARARIAAGPSTPPG